MPSDRRRSRCRRFERRHDLASGFDCEPLQGVAGHEHLERHLCSAARRTNRDVDDCDGVASIDGRDFPVEPIPGARRAGRGFVTGIVERQGVRPDGDLHAVAVLEQQRSHGPEGGLDGRDFAVAIRHGSLEDRHLGLGGVRERRPDAREPRQERPTVLGQPTAATARAAALAVDERPEFRLERAQALVRSRVRAVQRVRGGRQRPLAVDRPEQRHVALVDRHVSGAQVCLEASVHVPGNGRNRYVVFDTTPSMRRSRRSLLATAASATGVVATAGSAAIAGCSTFSGGPEPVRVLAAGSLQRAFDDGLRDAVDAPVALEARGSAALARLVADGQRDPDVLALADVALFDRVLDGPWHAAFATNALAVATADTPGGRRVQDAAAAPDRHWYDPVLAGDAALGRTDPDLDPLGYRTLFAVDRLAAHHDTTDLRDALLAPDQVYPETALLSTLETGAVDAAVVYESMATDRGLDVVDLPARVDLSDPGRADAYADVSYDLPDGTTVTGAPIEYGATLRSRENDAARGVFDELLAGDYLDAHGFEVPDAFPQFTRDAPDALVDR